MERMGVVKRNIVITYNIWRLYKETHQLLFVKGREERVGLRECNRGTEFAQIILYTHMEFSHKS
jgi:hypothetical protein